MGDRVYKTYGDKIIVTRVPRFDGYEPSAAQRNRREKMRAATAYARAVYADPAAKAVYVAAAKPLGRQPFRLAVSDFLRGHPRVTLGSATHEITHDAKGQRAPARRQAACCLHAEVPRANSGLGDDAEKRSELGLDFQVRRRAAACVARARRQNVGRRGTVTGRAASWGLPVTCYI